MKPTRYSDPNRLADVMALIQVLAQAQDTLRSEIGLSDQLQGKPTSGASTWIELAESHREFFRVRPPHKGNASPSVALISRHVLPEDHEGKRSPLSAEFTTKLLELAISLHDRELARTQRLAYLVPIGAAIIAGLFAMIVLLLQLYFRLPVGR